MQRKSLGMIETWGHVPAVEAADAGCKAAGVSLVGYEEVRAGLVTVFFEGDVAAVQASVAAGAAAARRVGKVVSTRVIPRPDRQLNAVTPSTAPPQPPVPRTPPAPPAPPSSPAPPPSPAPPAEPHAGPPVAPPGEAPVGPPVEPEKEEGPKEPKPPREKSQKGKSRRTGRKKTT